MNLEAVSTDDLRAELETRMRAIGKTMRGRGVEPDPLLYIVADITGCAPEKITTWTRPKKMEVYARALFAWALKRHRRWISFQEIAEQLHRTDHTTAIYYLGVANDFMKEKAFQYWMKLVDEQIQNGSTGNLQTEE